MSYGAYPNLSETSMVGIATSPDDVNWTKLGYISFTNLGYNIAFSSKFHVNATNGLFLTVALGINGIIPTNAFICDIAPTNFLTYSNLRFINTSTSVLGAEQSAGDMVYNNGIYYYFNSNGEEFTNSTLASSGWKTAAGNLSQNIGSAGPSVFYYNGLWYWFTTDGFLSYIYSTDLINWFGAGSQPVYSPPYANAIILINPFQEGKFIVENYAQPPPIQSISASSITGLTTNAITSGTNSVVVSSTNVVINIPATGNFSINVGGVSAFRVTNGVAYGNGGGLTNLNASQLTTGTLADALLSVDVVTNNTSQPYTNAAGNIIFGINSGEISTAQLAANASLNLTGRNGAKLHLEQSSGPSTLNCPITFQQIVTANIGYLSLCSNLIAPTSITFPATTVKWTNNIGVNIEIYIDNTGVTGTALFKNGGQIFGSILPADPSFHLQPGEYFSETYTTGTPTAKFSPE